VRGGGKLTQMGLLRSGEDREAKARLEDERRRRDDNPVRRFEYHVLRVGTKARAEAQLNELGTKGWQLVQVIEVDGHLAFYLEREVDSPAGVPDDVTDS
jgi:hypothetical protein